MFGVQSHIVDLIGDAVGSSALVHWSQISSVALCSVAKLAHAG